ncbi:MAG: hypothetical protein K6F50_08680 [Kiritimatiellae bacterium]|nr:hypothetical protein [Kiritimatiellia bacterium]
MKKTVQVTISLCETPEEYFKEIGASQDKIIRACKALGGNKVRPTDKGKCSWFEYFLGRPEGGDICGYDAMEDVVKRWFLMQVMEVQDSLKADGQNSREVEIELESAGDYASPFLSLARFAYGGDEASRIVFARQWGEDGGEDAEDAIEEPSANGDPLMGAPEKELSFSLIRGGAGDDVEKQIDGIHREISEACRKLGDQPFWVDAPGECVWMLYLGNHPVDGDKRECPDMAKTLRVWLDLLLGTLDKSLGAREEICRNIIVRLTGSAHKAAPSLTVAVSPDGGIEVGRIVFTSINHTYKD